MSADLLRLEHLLAAALRAPDPALAVQAAADDPTLPEDLRAALRAADPDGVRLSALLVARLRFERLVNGDREAAQWFDDDPAGFTAVFDRYHAEVAPTAFFPQEEAALFRRWRAG